MFRKLLPRLLSLALFTVFSSLVSAMAVLIAFGSITQASGEPGSGQPLQRLNFLLDWSLVKAVPAEVLVIIAFAVLVISSNVGNYVQSRLVRSELRIQAARVAMDEDPQQRRKSVAQLVAMRAVLGSGFALAAESARLTTFFLALMYLYLGFLGLWAVVAILAGALFAHRRFKLGRLSFESFQGKRRTDSSPRDLADSLSNVVSTTSTISLTGQLGLLGIAALPFLANQLTTGSVLNGDTIWIPIWLIFMSSVSSLVRQAASLGVGLAKLAGKEDQGLEIAE